MIKTHIRRLTMRANLDTQSGYGLSIQKTFDGLQRRGVFVSLRAIGVNEMWNQRIPVKMRGQIVVVPQPEEWEVLFCPPPNAPTPRKKTIWITMWESTILQPQIVSLMNQCEHVVVPCSWCERSFKDSGVTAPISAISLGYDPDVYFPTPISKNGPTIFGVAGRVAHCAKRKAIQEAIDLFIETFPTDENVRLHVKIHPSDKINPVRDRRVKISEEVMEPYQLGEWLRGLTAYLTLCRGEGFGLWPLNAIACGRPVIGCRYSGQADYMTDGNSFLVDFKEVPADDFGAGKTPYQGMWCEPDTKHASEIMKAIHKKRSLAIAKAELGPLSVGHLTWDSMTDSFHALLEEIGVWKT